MATAVRPTSTNGRDTQTARMEQVLVTPNFARQLLSTQIKNRKLKGYLIEVYATDMVKGLWIETGSPLKVDVNGNLFDGQHRLHAIIKSGFNVHMWIAYGLPVAAMEATDTGARRSTADQLQLRGEVRASWLAAAAMHLWRYEEEILGNTKVTSTTVLLDVVDRHPGLRDSVAQVRDASDIIPPGIAGFVHYVGSRSGREKADVFISYLTDGVGLQKGHPAYELRERLIRNVGANARLQTRDVLALTIKAWNAFRVGAPMKLLRWNFKNEPFPEIDDSL